MINKKTWGYGKKVIDFKELVDEETGEITLVSIIDRPIKDFGWEKVWIKSLLYTYDIFGFKPIDILKYLLLNKNYENKVYTNKSIISRDIKVSRVTVHNVIEKLINNDIIKPIELGYQINPDIIFNSLEASRKNITRLQVVLDYHGFESKNKAGYIFEVEK